MSVSSLTSIAQKPLERWLTKAPPEGAVELCLSVAGLQDTRVQSWTRAEYDGTPARALAQEILAASDGHAESVGRECRYSLRWYTESGGVLIAMQWRAGDGMERALDGSADSQIAQLQRHLEAMAKLSASAMQQNLQLMQELCESQAQRIRDLENLRDAYEGERTAKALEGGNGTTSKLEEVLTTLVTKQLTASTETKKASS